MTLVLAVAAGAAAISCAVAAWWVPMRMGATGAEAVGQLSQQLAATHDERARAVMANEVLGDLEHSLRPDLRRPTKLAWIAFLSCLGLAIAAYWSSSAWVLATCLGFGALGPVSCLWARRATTRAAAQARRMVDDRVESSLGALYHAEFVLPKRREMRWKRGKRNR